MQALPGAWALCRFKSVYTINGICNHMKNEMHVWIAAYDIHDIRSLNKVSKLLLSCMVRIQKSVFIGYMDESMADTIYNKAKEYLSEADCFLLYPICNKDAAGIRCFGAADSSCFLVDRFLII